MTPAIERPSALPREALRQKVLSVLHPQARRGGSIACLLRCGGRPPRGVLLAAEVSSSRSEGGAFLMQQMRGTTAPHLRCMQEPTRFYQILTGSPGSGKSTVVREACAAIGGGIGYVDVSPAFEIFDFGRDLGNAFNFRRGAVRLAEGLGRV